MFKHLFKYDDVQRQMYNSVLTCAIHTLRQTLSVMDVPLQTIKNVVHESASGVDDSNSSQAGQSKLEN